jgi:Matrixin
MFLLLAVAPAITPHYFSAMAAYGKDQADDKDDDGDDDDGDNNSASEEDFEEQNSIQICCAWGRNLADAILTYFIDKEGSNKQQQHDVRNAVQEWDRNIDSLELEETSSKKNGDILIEFQREYERYANDDDDEEQLVAGQSVNTFDNKGFIEKVHIIVYKGTSDYKFDDDTVERIVKHEMGHALGLGHANFGGNLMAEKVNDGTENISECEIKAVLQANHWKLMADDMQPDLPKRNGIVCNE